MVKVMSRILISVLLIWFSTANRALTEAPKVVVDIAPVHSLVSMVMKGVGEPTLIIPANASPHDYTLRPSAAKALQNADIIFWMGSSLTPWLDRATTTLMKDAQMIALLDTEDTIILEVRDELTFDADHGDHEEHEDHDEHDEHKDHVSEHKDGHEHHGIDPHAWLSAKNASVWLSVIAAHLSEIDPKNKETYKTNAAVGQKDITDLATDISKTLSGVQGRSFIVYHDAFQYFENDFNFTAAGSISPSDAAPVSPARIAAIRSMIEKEGINCILSEPQYSQGLIQSVSSGTEVNLGIIDAIGAGITIGPDLYNTLMRNVAKTFADCF
jgi:zinc transport system substrate-binding protein